MGGGKPLERFPSDGRQDGVDEVEEGRHVGEDHCRDVQLVVPVVGPIVHVQGHFGQSH